MNPRELAERLLHHHAWMVCGPRELSPEQQTMADDMEAAAALLSAAPPPAPMGREPNLEMAWHLFTRNGTRRNPLPYESFAAGYNAGIRLFTLPPSAVGGEQPRAVTREPERPYAWALEMSKDGEYNEVMLYGRIEATHEDVDFYEAKGWACRIIPLYAAAPERTPAAAPREDEPIVSYVDFDENREIRLRTDAAPSQPDARTPDVAAITRLAEAAFGKERVAAVIPPDARTVGPSDRERQLVRDAFCAGYVANGPTHPFEMLEKAEIYVTATLRSSPADTEPSARPSREQVEALVEEFAVEDNSPYLRRDGLADRVLLLFDGTPI